MPLANSVIISGAVEGMVDEAVLTRLVDEAGGQVGPIYGKNGKSHLRRVLGGYNNAARFSPWLVLVDFDQDAECAPPLVAAWLPAPAPMMRLRVALRAIEAWLLADRERLAGFLRVAAPLQKPNRRTGARAGDAPMRKDEAAVGSNRIPTFCFPFER